MQELLRRDPPPAWPWALAVALIGTAALILGLFRFDEPSTLPLLTGLGGLGLGVAMAWAVVLRARAALRPPLADERLLEPTDTTIRTIIEVLDGPALVLDGEARVQVYNWRANELFPTLSDGQSLAQVGRHPELIETVHAAQSDGLSKSVQIIDRMPYARRMLVSVSPLDKRSEEATLPRLLVQFRDLSEQDRLAQMRTDFIANASHELRTPLASLKGFIETLQGPASSDAVARKRFLSIMEAQAARMARILDDLLSLSRIEMRAHVTPADDIELSNLVRDVAQGLEPIARDAGITLQCDAVHEPCSVKGDRDELVQVFQNLIQNAIKYGRKGGNVSVSVRRDGAVATHSGRVIVAITDDGPGIAEEHLPRLTERFYRVDTATSREKGGTGLGLAIVKHILNRHRGELKIASAPGKGSTFSVVLDAIPPPATQ